MASIDGQVAIHFEMELHEDPVTGISRPQVVHVTDTWTGKNLIPDALTLCSRQLAPSQPIRLPAGATAAAADVTASPVAQAHRRTLAPGGRTAFLGALGTAAMIFVGGGIIVHGLEVYGFGALAHLIHDAAHHAAGLVPAAPGVAAWLTEAIGSGFVGVAIGAALIPVAGHVLAPMLRFVSD